MSGILKSVGKVFKKVFAVVKKVLPYALVVGAIVLTGGAAIGALPAVGTVLGGLGLSAGVTSALAGAVTMAGWGGLAGLVTGGPKGMLKGGLIGGLLGGVGAAAGLGIGGGSGLLGGGSLFGGGAIGAAPGAAAAQGAAGLAHEAVLGGVASAAPAAAGAAAPAAAGGGGGLFSGLLGNGGIGSILSGLGGGVSAAGEVKAQQQAYKERQKQIAKNYDISGSFLGQSMLSPYAQPGYMQAPELDPYAGTGQWVYDPAQGKLVRRPIASAPATGG